MEILYSTLSVSGVALAVAGGWADPLKLFVVVVQGQMEAQNVDWKHVVAEGKVTGEK